MLPAATRTRLLLVVSVLTTACGGATRPTPLPCAYTVTLSASTFASGGGTGSVTVATANGCAWTAASAASWLTVTSGGSATGPGSAGFSVSANTDRAARSGALTVAGQNLQVQQEGAPVACAFSLSPTSATFDKDGGSGSTMVETADGCAWSAASADPSWLTITRGTGTGTGSALYSVARNSLSASRTGTLTIAGLAFRVTQSGDAAACTYSVTPVQFSPCLAAFELTSQLTTAAGCTWTVESSVPWITLASGSSGSGAHTIRLAVAANYDAPRAGTVMVRWPTPTAGQNLHVAQAGCYYSVTRDNFTFTASGGAGSFDVVQQSDPIACGGPLQNGCVWTANADAPWLTVTSSMPRSGDDRVNFSVSANTTGAARNGTITVRGKVVRIVQGG